MMRKPRAEMSRGLALPENFRWHILVGDVEADDPRYVDSNDPRAVLRAWGGDSAQHATMDMGGWTDTDETAFRHAVQAEAIRGAGEPLKYIVIEPIE